MRRMEEAGFFFLSFSLQKMNVKEGWERKWKKEDFKDKERGMIRIREIESLVRKETKA